MAIDTEFIDFIVPIATIRAKYPGGWKQCLKDHEHLLGGRVWYDDYLFRNGAMNPGDIGPKIEAWTDLGFTRFKGVAGKSNGWTFVFMKACTVAPHCPVIGWCHFRQLR